MKAIVKRYGVPGDVLRLADAGLPEVGEEDVLGAGTGQLGQIRGTARFIRGEPVLLRPAGIGGVRRPKFLIPGGDLAGTVERVGGGVTAFEPGADVYGFGYPVPSPGRRCAADPSCSHASERHQLGGPPRCPGRRNRAAGIARRRDRAGAARHSSSAPPGCSGTFMIRMAKHLGAQVTGTSAAPTHVGLVRGSGCRPGHRLHPGRLHRRRRRLRPGLPAGRHLLPGRGRTSTDPGTLIESFGDGGRWWARWAT